MRASSTLVGMARRPRFEEAGAVHHVWARGVERRVIFVDDHDRVVYLRLLRAVIRRTGWECRAYCLMGNHVHLVIRTPEPNLSAGMHWLHTHYAGYFNERHDRIGHLFQSRFGSSRLWSESAVRDKMRYVEENPVRAGLCRFPEDWPWSSASGPALRLAA